MPADWLWQTPPQVHRTVINNDPLKLMARIDKLFKIVQGYVKIVRPCLLSALRSTRTEGLRPRRTGVSSDMLHRSPPQNQYFAQLNLVGKIEYADVFFCNFLLIFGR